MAAITVGQLMANLAECPLDAIVILAKDSEGNDYSPLPDDQGYSIGSYVADSTWSGEFYDGITYDDPTRGVRAVCLWPTN
jgi:hypothetical protein